MEKTKEQINRKLIEWINSNRNNKTRIIFEMEDKDDSTLIYAFTLGNLFDIAYDLGKKEAGGKGN